jgi:DinB superfamily
VPRALSQSDILALLAETPTRIAAVTTGLAPAKLRASPGPDEWSANDVLAHLRSCGDVWGGYMRRVLAEDGPTIRVVNPRTWIEQTDYLALEFAPSLRAFAMQRADLVAVLASLTPGDWSRAATVTGAGRPFQRTVLDYAERMARHERPHVKQIEHIVDMQRS